MNKFAYVYVVCRMEYFLESETLILIFRRDDYRSVGDCISVEQPLIERKKFTRYLGLFVS